MTSASSSARWSCNASRGARPPRGRSGASPSPRLGSGHPLAPPGRWSVDAWSKPYVKRSMIMAKISRNNKGPRRSIMMSAIMPCFLMSSLAASRSWFYARRLRLLRADLEVPLDGVEQLGHTKVYSFIDGLLPRDDLLRRYVGHVASGGSSVSGVVGAMLFLAP